MKQFHGHTFSFLCWHLSYWNRKMEQDISKSLSLSFFYSNVHAYWLFCQLLGEQEHIRPQSWQTWTESHNSAIFNTVIYVSAPLALFLSLLSLSHSLSYFLFFQQKVSSQIEQMQADSSQEVHPSEPLCLYLRHASTDCEGTSFPLSLTGRCACVWV